MPKLKQHSVIQKSYQCQYCKVKCRRPQDLRRHLLVHAEASFECDLCGNKFTRFDTLRRHKRDNCRNAQSVYQTRIAARQAEQKFLDAQSRHQNEGLRITQVYPYEDMRRARARERVTPTTATPASSSPIAATKLDGPYATSASSTLETPYISPSLADANIYNQQSFNSGFSTATHLQAHTLKVPFYPPGPLYIPPPHHSIPSSPSNHLNDQQLPPPPYPSSLNIQSSIVHAPQQLTPNSLVEFQQGNIPTHASEFFPNGMCIERLISPPHATYHTQNFNGGRENATAPPPQFMAHYGHIVQHDAAGMQSSGGTMPSITSILNFRLPQTVTPVVMGDNYQMINSPKIPTEQKERGTKVENSEVDGKESVQFKNNQAVKHLANNLQNQSTKKLGLEPIEPKTEHINHKRSPCRFDEYTR